LNKIRVLQRDPAVLVTEYAENRPSTMNRHVREKMKVEKYLQSIKE
jgi:hypothetical protein